MSAPDRIASKAPANYRPDVDGLRSLAVTGVVLFHAGLLALPGGYVGVDVFFVISGYLITRQVVMGVETSTFSFSEFYLRRVRRLLPAALVTVAATLAFALIVLSPVRVAEIAKSAAAAAASVSNFFFWQESGYWDAASGAQPLLHTWSLSVEEQFYLLWPLVIFLLLRRAKKAVLPILLAVIVVSVVVTTWMTTSDPDAAFYLTPFRTYEFAIGAVCVWLERMTRSRRIGGTVPRTAAWVAGIGLIVFAMLTFDENAVSFPSWIALVPAVGTALVILADRPRRLDAVLNNPFMLYVGLRSYSIYLIHWPVLVFAGELFGDLTLLSATVCVALTMVLAELQYRFVERPLRIRGKHEHSPVRRVKARRFATKAVPAMAVAVALCATSVGVAWANSRPQAYSGPVQALIGLDYDALNAQRRVETNAVCKTKTDALCGTLKTSVPNVLVLGDSVGPEGVMVMNTLTPDVNFVTGERASCAPALDLASNPGIDSACLDYNEKRLASVAKHIDEFDLVVLSTRLTVESSPRIERTLEWLRDQGAEVAVLGMNAHYKQDAWRTIVESGDPENAPEALHGQLDVTSADNDALREMVEGTGSLYIDRWNWMCDDDSCRAFFGEGVKNLVMADTAHMTRGGTIAFAESIAGDREIRELLRGLE
jgi:peptidoglycan/LPS O-acetylase OafA/YrhL